ncbi:hypothetical protein LMG6871_00604 [Ralstonia edaphis]|uniref:hypothetical protein n=1 Tax=Ralstonia edaphi TaxID=3058599 RepID=UPI0028F5CC35|nr:hypothetical protein [Ralstonia sp. LMG 6871]CAJ0712965.1 hypothetical protein LMG6871_00604 [Ralstonia sp. LMG 6871]
MIWRRCILIAWISTHCQAAVAGPIAAGTFVSGGMAWQLFEGLVAKSEIAKKLAALKPATVCWLPNEGEMACYRSTADVKQGGADFYWVRSPDQREEDYPLYYHLPSAKTMEFGQIAMDAKLVVRCLSSEPRMDGR